MRALPNNTPLDSTKFLNLYLLNEFSLRVMKLQENEIYNRHVLLGLESENKFTLVFIKNNYSFAHLIRLLPKNASSKSAWLPLVK